MPLLVHIAHANFLYGFLFKFLICLSINWKHVFGEERKGGVFKLNFYGFLRRQHKILPLKKIARL